jgi:hypothetical protein
MNQIQKQIDDIVSRLDIIECVLANKILKVQQEPKAVEDLWWSIKLYKNCIVINNTPQNEEFRAFIKEKGAKWLTSKKGWMFSKSKQDTIFDAIKEKFPDWRIKDQRNEPEQTEKT